MPYSYFIGYIIGNLKLERLNNTELASEPVLCDSEANTQGI